jgi:hypothetical protein
MRSDHLGRTLLMVQALGLAGLALVGLDAAGDSPTGIAAVFGFTLNAPHSVLLLATAAASTLAAMWGRVSRMWALTQATAYTLIFVIGAAGSMGGAPHTWLALNGPDHFLHLGLAVLGGLLGTALLARPAVLAEADEGLGGLSSATPREEESAETREMIDAEMAVAEGHATTEQARRVHDDAQQRAETERDRAWQQFQR